MRVSINHGCRGFTLLECLIVIMMGSLLAVGTLRVIGDARMVRSNARDRLMLATLTQSELDKLRAERPTLQHGTRDLRNLEGYPEDVELRIAVEPHTSGTLYVEMLATRRSIEGKPTVRLTTLVPAGAP